MQWGPFLLDFRRGRGHIGRLEAGGWRLEAGGWRLEIGGKGVSMKITGVRTSLVKVTKRGDWVFVRVDTDEGITGIGEASQSGNDGLALATLRQMADRLIGQDPLRIGTIWGGLAHPGGVFSGRGGRPMQTALSGVEQALWDILGKALSVPVHVLLGGRLRDRIRLYANINRATWDRSPEGFAENARCAVQEGFTAIKCAPFDEVHRRNLDRADLRRGADAGLARLWAIREAIGKDVDLLVDCHARFTPSLARQIAKEMEALGMFWYEEPVPCTQLQVLSEVTACSPVPVASGESLFGREGFWEMIADRAVDVLMPDVKHAGGIQECVRIAGLAEVMETPIAPHNPAGPVSTAASVHLCSVIPNFLILEYAWGEVPWRSSIVAPAEEIVDGHLLVPEVPGLGVALNEEVEEAHRG